MTAQKMNLINALILIIVGLWGFIDVNSPEILQLQVPSEGFSKTALIPVLFGAILLLCNKGVKNANKLISHIAVIVTLLILIGLVKPFTAQFIKINVHSDIGLLRVYSMMVFSFLTLISFIGSFIENRKKAS